MNKIEKILITTNIFLYISIAIFSYSYVDLNLTLSNIAPINDFVYLMQQLGYFNRFEASVIYLLLITSVFIIFIINLILFSRKKITKKYLKVSAIVSTIILLFSYPFLSSDLFNYMFDAKIIIKYHSNPYAYRPLDFPTDEWLRFMRWIHRYSPYGPLWLGLSIIPATLGFGKFVLNLLTFKIFIAIFHLVNTYLIFKILIKINNKYSLIGTAFYSLNPILLLEGVANAHNDVVLATFLLLPIYFFVINKKVLAYLSLLAGALIKYIPILILPWLIRENLSKNKKVTRLIYINLATMVIFTFIFSTFRISVPFVSGGSTQTQFQAWYLFWTLPFVALTSNIFLFILGIAISIGAAIRYIPFLLTGEWTQPGTIIFMQLAVIVSIVSGFIISIIKKYFIK